MASPQLVGRNFDQGFMSDVPRDQLPRGAVYRMRDYVPQLEAPARKRGGTTASSADLNALSAATSLSGVAWAPFPDDPHLIAVSDAGKVYSVKQFDSSGGAFVGATGLAALTHAPFWHTDRMILLQSLAAAAATPQKYIGGAVSPLGGTPPQARVGWSYGDYLALANAYVSATLYASRIYYSGVGNSESWNTGSGFWAVPVAEIVGGLLLRNVQLVWSYDETWMVTGDTPPPGGNFENRLLFKGNGCMDGRTIATYREYAIWANNTGVWKTDGATLTDLTYRGGISNYWRSLVSSFNFEQGWSAAAGVYRGFYVITVANAAGQVVTTLLCDLDREVWFEFQNIDAAMFASRSSGPGTALAAGSEELFMAHRAAPRVDKLSSCWSPAASNASDADGQVVLPEIETGFYKLGSSGLKRIRRGYLSYDIRTAGASPYLQVSKIVSPDDTTYDVTTPNLPATTMMKREAFNVREKAYGIALKIAQVGASADTRLYDIELEGHALEGSR